MKEAALSKLTDLSVEAYAVPVETEDTLVILGRIKASTEPEFKNVESRLISFIEKALVKAELPEYKDEDKLRLRFSRLWLLKEKSLRYTWDFTFKGDLSLIEPLFEDLAVPSLTVTRVEEVNTQTVKPKRGAVRPVRVGTL
ncbi:MAG: hypothetical protein VXZ72_02840 [Chlamydiota bacterium]|nr:hypothetical protein [Chlamydiota bacterium]